MRTELLHALDVTTEPQSNRWLRWPVGFGLIVHGLIHTMGVVLLLELGEPGELTYAVARPEPGTSLATGFAIIWALATVLFIVSGYQLIRGGRWAALVVTASILSLLAIGPMMSAAPIGGIVSALTLVIGLWCLSRDRTQR